MTTLVFHFEDYNLNLYSGRSPGDIDLWRTTAKNLGCTTLVMVDLSTGEIGLNYTHSDEDIEFVRVSSLDDALALRPDATQIFLEERRVVPDAIKLSEFSHPNDAIYIVGPDSFGLQPSEERTFVCIDTHAGSMWSIAAAAVALGHRMLGDD